MNLLTKTTDLAMYMTLAYVNEGDIAVDATCGNGLDTIALSDAVGRKGTVISFDVQPEAVETTRALLRRELKENTVVVEDSFVNMEEYIGDEIEPAAIIFNLGYLPGSDKSIRTTVEETMDGVRTALNLIKKDGVVTITMYSGHLEGAREKEALLSFSRTLPKKDYHVVYLSMLNQPVDPPEILMITKKTEGVTV